MLCKMAEYVEKHNLLNETKSEKAFDEHSDLHMPLT